MKVYLTGNPVLELLFPSNACCIGCGESIGFYENWLCDECRGLLTRMDIKLSAEGENWPRGALSSALCVYRYARPVNGIIRHLKYDGVYALTDYITDEMAKSLADWNDVKIDFLVPVPMHISRKRVRGGNQTELLARSLSSKTGLPVLDALSRVINTKQQARCSESERSRNLLGAFKVMCDVEGMNLLLIDDVLTSGATANACAAALIGDGANEVNLLCVASARH